MALKSGASTSPHKSELKNIPDGNVYVGGINKLSGNPKKVASGNVGSTPLSLKTEPASGGLK